MQSVVDDVDQLYAKMNGVDIEEMAKYDDEIKVLVDDVESALTHIKQIKHDSELLLKKSAKELRDKLNRILGIDIPDEPTPMSYVGAASQVATSRVSVPAPRMITRVPRVNKVIDVNVAGNITVPAFSVDTLDQVPIYPIYYVKKTNQFALGIQSGQKKLLLTGNIGQIIPRTEVPTNVKTCKHGPNCKDPANCTFWHDPNKNSNSTDKRNFMQNSWHYYAGNKDTTEAPICHSGDIRYLVSDIPHITEEEADRRQYQIMHEILNGLVLPTGLLESIRREKLG